MIQIVIGQRGWVWVGRVERGPEGVVIKDARVIRRWGTKDKGLGFLKHGPTAETILDTPATITLHPLAIVAVQDVEQSAWEKHI